MDIIDINVSETTETVDINVTPNVTIVNINRNLNPVTSVNGQVGDVVIPIPTKTSDLINDGSNGEPFISLIDIPSHISYGLYAQTALSNIVTHSSGEASIIGSGVGTLSVPQDTFKVGDSFVAKMCGKLSCANNEVLHIHIKSNGITIIDGLIYTLATATNKGWELTMDFTITKIGGSGTAEIFSNCLFTYNKNANNNIDGVHSRQITSTGFDTTVQNNLTISAEWIGSNATNSIQSQNFTLIKVF